MKTLFSAVSRFGENVEVLENGVWHDAKAFIEPVSLTDPKTPGVPTPAGVADDRCYRILIGTDAVSGPAAVIGWGGEQFEFLRLERMGGNSHWEGIARLKTEVAENA